MIATEAALYGHHGATGSGVTTILVCDCGQELDSAARRYCPRCGCSLR